MKHLSTTIRAFALLELAIALSILGVIAYMSMPLLGKLHHWQQARTTAMHQEQVIEALAAYVLTHQRLPCPATNTNGDAAAICTVADSNIGFIPFRSLGISEKLAKDGHHHWMTYAIQPSLAYARLIYLQPPELAIDPKTIFCATTADGALTIHNAQDESAIKAPDFAAIILIAHGPSGGYYLDNGTTQIVTSADVHKINYAARSGSFVTKMPQPSGLHVFDDTVYFISRNNLMAQKAKYPCRKRD